jgi:hypothetical protein
MSWGKKPQIKTARKVSSQAVFISIKSRATRLSETELLVHVTGRLYGFI